VAHRLPAPTSGIAAWRSVPAAVLVGLVVLVVGFCAFAATPDPPGRLGYSDAGEHHSSVAAFELEVAPTEDLSGAPPFPLRERLLAPGAPGPAPSPAPFVTRDRSPPVR
jgi:hypothetical protein